MNEEGLQLKRPACTDPGRSDGIKRLCKARGNICGFEAVVPANASGGVQCPTSHAAEQRPVAAEGRHRGTRRLKGTH